MITKEIIEKWMLENKGSILHDTENPNVFTGYITITPERAEMLMAINTQNRRLGKTTQIPGLIDALENGYWDANVSKINITNTNKLSDGQNRLFAGIESQTTFRCLVTYGVNETAQHVTDRRGHRTLGNDLTIGGFTAANHNAAITRVLFYMNERNMPINTILGKGQAISSVSDARLFDYFIENKDFIIEMQKRVAKIYYSVRDLEISQTILNAIVPAFDYVNVEDATCFWERLSTGITEVENDPIILLRKRLTDNAHNKANKIPNIVIAGLIIKAWNFYMRGEQVRLLKYTSGGANPEKFPEIYNPYLEEQEEA